MVFVGDVGWSFVVFASVWWLVGWFVEQMLLLGTKWTMNGKMIGAMSIDVMWCDVSAPFLNVHFCVWILLKWWFLMKRTVGESG